MPTLLKTITFTVSTNFKTTRALPAMPASVVPNFRTFSTNKKFLIKSTKSTTKTNACTETSNSTELELATPQTSSKIIKDLTKSYKTGDKKILSQTEVSALVNALTVVEPFLSYLIKNCNVSYNKYRWNANEKLSMSQALIWMNKTPKEVTREDLIVLSMFIRTRDSIQCRRFLDYRNKTGTPASF